METFAINKHLPLIEAPAFQVIKKLPRLWGHNLTKPNTQTVVQLFALGNLTVFDFLKTCQNQTLEPNLGTFSLHALM